MRVSGNLFERLIVKILPLCLTLGVLSYITSNKTIIEFIKPLVGITIILWVFDSFFILTKGIKHMTINGNHVIIGEDKIFNEDILFIVPRKDKRIGIDIKTIEIEYLKDGLLKKQRIITKPTFLDLFGRRFRTIDLILYRFPELRDRVMEETED